MGLKVISRERERDREIEVLVLSAGLTGALCWSEIQEFYPLFLNNSFITLLDFILTITRWYIILIMIH